MERYLDIGDTQRLRRTTQCVMAVETNEFGYKVKIISKNDRNSFLELKDITQKLLMNKQCVVALKQRHTTKFKVTCKMKIEIFVWAKTLYWRD